MKTQIVFIHGGNTYSKYVNYLQDLQNKTIWDPYGTESKKRWKQAIFEEFGETIDVFFPSMPSSNNAKYTEWKIWFERYFAYLGGEVILIGHSLGGLFLLKYLSENTPPFPIKGLLLVSAPIYEDSFGFEDSGDFIVDFSKLSHIEDLTKNILVYHSTDDEIVPVSHAKKIEECLSSSRAQLFTDRGHFIGEEFPEILKDLKDLL